MAAADWHSLLAKVDSGSHCWPQLTMFVILGYNVLVLL